MKGATLNEEEDLEKQTRTFLLEGERFLDHGDVQSAASCFDKAARLGGEKFPAAFAGLV